MSNLENKTNKNNITEKIKTLDSLIDWFYSDDFSLEKSLEKYKSALSLKKEIETDLNNLKNEVEILSSETSSR